MASLSGNESSFEGIENIASDLFVGNKVFLFRRALLKRNIRVVTSRGGRAGQLPLWGALGQGEVKLFRGLMSTERGLPAHRLARDKTATKKVLEAAKLRVPRSYELKGSGARENFAAIESLGLLPGVLKPNSGSHGSGVCMNITDFEAFKKALVGAGASPIFEEQIDGKDYRMLTIGKSFFAATERRPASVSGDGVSTVEELVQEKNRKRALNPSTKKHPVVIDEGALTCLERQGLTANSVPPADAEVFLRFVANIGSGGDAIDRTSTVHPGFVSICEQIPELLGEPEILGIDLLAEDVSKSPESQKWAFIEVNANPDIDLQHWPWEGDSLDPADRLAELYFPSSSLGELISAVIEIEGRIETAEFGEWIARNSALAGLDVRPRYDKSQAGLKVEGTRVAIDWFVETLIRQGAGVTIRNILMK